MNSIQTINADPIASAAKTRNYYQEIVFANKDIFLLMHPIAQNVHKMDFGAEDNVCACSTTTTKATNASPVLLIPTTMDLLGSVYAINLSSGPKASASSVD